MNIKQTRNVSRKLFERINEETTAGFKVGDRVYHPSKGEGTVTYTSNAQITVDWDFPGQKILGPEPIPASKIGGLKKINEADERDRGTPTKVKNPKGTVKAVKAESRKPNTARNAVKNLFESGAIADLDDYKN